MFKIKFKVFHDTCWGSAIGLEFPNYEFSSIDCRSVDNKIVHLLFAQGDPTNFDKIIEFFEKREDSIKVETISKSEENIYLRIFTKNDAHTTQFSDMFFENNCFMTNPTRFVDKYEIWSLGSASKENIKKVYNIMKKNHPTELIYLKEGGIEENLTKKQREVINFAKYFGYYEWPRRNSISEICKIVNIKKTTFLSHLRNAENKIINQYNS